MKKQNLKAQMHLEIILSLVIFVGFVLFILLFLNPLKNYSAHSEELNKISDILIENLSSYYGFVSFSLIKSEHPCFSIENPKSDMNFFVTNSSGDPIDFAKDGDKIIIKDAKNQIFFKVHYSNTFDPVSTDNCNKELKKRNNYTLGAIYSDKVVFYSSIIELNKTYMNNYLDFKQRNNIHNDFNYVIYNKEIMIMNDSLSNLKNKGRQIVSRNIPIKVVYENMSYADLTLNLRVYT